MPQCYQDHIAHNFQLLKCHKLKMIDYLTLYKGGYYYPLKFEILAMSDSMKKLSENLMGRISQCSLMPLLLI